MKPGLKILLLLVAATLVFISYALWGPETESDFMPKKINLSAYVGTPDSVISEVSESKAETIAFKHEKDTASKNIFFFGDSMLEGLCRRFIDYADENGHTLHTVLWYSSSTQIWAKTDTLQHFMKKYNPDFVVVCLGSNELFVKDVDKRKKYIERIVEKIGDVPFVWISPPNWKDDTGINAAIIKTVGKDRYFDSTHLTLARGKDHAHPTFNAAAKWMDLVAQWMESDSTRHPIKMAWPKKDVPPRNVVMLQPLN